MNNFSYRMDSSNNSVPKLIVVWVGAAAAALLCWILIFSLFFGYNRVAPNEEIYEGYRYPNAPGSSDLETHEGWGRTTYGENGLVANKEIRDDARRILFLGDSFVQARQVSDKYKFTELAEAALNTDSDSTFQCLNFGFVGQSLTTYLSFSPKFDAKYHPERVFVALSEEDFYEIFESDELTKKLTTEKLPILVRPKRYSRIESIVNDAGLRGFGIRLRLQAEAFREKGESTQLNWDREDADGFAKSVELQLGKLRDVWGDRLVIIFLQNVRNFGKSNPPRESVVIRKVRAMSITYINSHALFLHEYRRYRPTAGFSNSQLGSGHLNRHGHQILADAIVQFLRSET